MGQDHFIQSISDPAPGHYQESENFEGGFYRKVKLLLSHDRYLDMHELYKYIN